VHQDSFSPPGSNPPQSPLCQRRIQGDSEAARRLRLTARRASPTSPETNSPRDDPGIVICTTDEALSETRATRISQHSAHKNAYVATPNAVRNGPQI
jgi:hypothetical protein